MNFSYRNMRNSKVGIGSPYFLLLLGFYLFMLCKLVLVFYTPQAIRGLLMVISVFCIILGYSRCPKNSVKTDNDIRLCALFLVILGIIAVLRGFLSIDEVGIKSYMFLTVDYYCLSYFLPMLLFIDYNELYFNELKRFSIISMITVLLFLILNSSNLLTDAYSYYTTIIMDDETFYLELSRATASFTILSIPILFYFIGKKSGFTFYITLCLLIISLIPMALYGRRGSLFVGVLCLILPFTVKYLKFKYLLIGFLLIFIILSIDWNTIFSKHFIILSGRISEDTRTWAEKEFYNDMTLSDWLFGRGSLGAYHSPTYGERTAIETGYLFFVLKGGIFYSIAYCYIIIMSFYRGFVKAKNQTTKLFALYLFPFIPNLYLFGLPRIDFRFLMMWLCIYVCSSKKLRNNFDIKF